MKFAVAIVAILILLVADSSGWLFSGRGSSSGSGSGTFRSSPRDTRMSRTLPHDIRTQSDLTQLYNRRVTSAQRVRRPLGNGQHMLGDLSHSGVVVTTNDGGRWLVHKGPDSGRSSDTVVTDVRHMSSRWRPAGPSRDVSSSRVGDYVRAGGRDYNLCTDNCHDASDRMLDLE